MVSIRTVTIGVVALLAVAVTSVPAQRPAMLEVVVQDDKGKPVEEAVVSLAPAGATAVPARPAAGPATMDQVDKEFVPHILPVAIGTAVAFPNRDNIKHHVYSFSPAKKFELPLYTGTPASPIVFDKGGVVVLGCNIHDWMVAYVFVTGTPYFAKTGAEGRARLGDVPPGAYEARVWHPRMRLAPEKTAQAVTVSAGDPGRLAWSLVLKREWKVPRGTGRYEGPSPQ